MPRQTRQQQAVLQAIEHSGRCLHAAEVWALAKQAVPSLNLSTVYRQLKLLHEQQLVARVELPGEPPRFEALCELRHSANAANSAHTDHADHADQSHHAGHGAHAGASAHARALVPDDHHHHHFHCTGCERVFTLHACPGPLEPLVPAGFTLQRHDLTLHGHCADCALAAAGKHSGSDVTQRTGNRSRARAPARP